MLGRSTKLHYFKRILLALAAFLPFCISSCTNAVEENNTTSTTTSSIPQHLDIFIGGMMGPSKRITLQENGSIRYSYNPKTHTALTGTKHQTLRISQENWEKFRSLLDRSHIWNWKSTYSNTGIYDGTQWSIYISYQDRTIVSQGDNSFPKQREFQGFVMAIDRLTNTQN